MQQHVQMGSTGQLSCTEALQKITKLLIKKDKTEKKQPIKNKNMSQKCVSKQQQNTIIKQSMSFSNVMQDSLEK